MNGMPASSEQTSAYRVGDILRGNHLANEEYSITREGVLVQVVKILTNDRLLIHVIDEITLEPICFSGSYIVEAKCFDLYTGAIKERESSFTHDWKQILEAEGVLV